MIPTNKTRKDDMQSLVDGYNSMMKDPKEYAETTYARQIKSQGRAWGEWNGRDTTQHTVKSWPKGHIPV